VAYAKREPGKINYASSGLGSIQNIGAEQLSLLSDIKMVHVPYRGAGPAMNDLIAGTVDLFITTPPSAVGHIQAGTINALAMASKTRHPCCRKSRPRPKRGCPASSSTPGLQFMRRRHAGAGHRAARDRDRKNRQERAFSRARRRRRRLCGLYDAGGAGEIHRNRTRILDRRHQESWDHRESP